MSIEKKITKAEMVTLYGLAMMDCAELELKNVDIKTEINFDSDDTNFCLTVFDRKKNNKSVRVYTFLDYSEAERLIATFIATVSTDDLSQWAGWFQNEPF